MSLQTGARLGPYEIVGKLGAGGMGEVYRARDSRLDREVALKVLPADVAGDPSRRARFEQEARAAAALSHPNVVATFDVGTADGVFYIVSELVEGEGLDALLARETLPLRKVLDIVVQVADGMAAAHAAGITHRDLKPANVMLTRDGRAKILDFGLAKKSDRTSPVRGQSGEHDATVTVHQTDPGMIVGTVNYMSPEQATGKPVDPRSDQFAFGVILYEMLAGKKPFERPTGVQTMSAIVAEDAPAIEREAPAPLKWVVERCLAKEPGDRYESSRDLYRDLRMLRDRLSEAVTATMAAVAPVAAPRGAAVRKSSGWVRAAVFFAAGAVLAAGALLLTRGAPAERQFRFTPISFEPGGQSGAVWSPDGKAIVYTVGVNGVSQLFLRYLDQPTAQQLTRFAEPSQALSWDRSGKIYFRSLHAPQGIWSVASVGGEPQPVAPLKLEGIASMSMSPDGTALAMMGETEDGTRALLISSPLGNEPKPYEPSIFEGRDVYNIPQVAFAPDGKSILLMTNMAGPEQAWLMPYPAGSGEPRQLLDKLPSFGGTPLISWMPDSRRVVMSLVPAPGAASELWVLDTESKSTSVLLSGTTSYSSPSVSPDGTRMAFAEAKGAADIISIDLASAAVTRLIATQRMEFMPDWAGKRDTLTYVTDRAGAFEIWLRAPGTGDRPLVTQRDFASGPTQWFMSPALAPEADRVIYSRIEFGGTAELWISSVSGGAPVRLTTDQPEGGEFAGSWSPDGAWFAYWALDGNKMSLKKVRTSGLGTPEVVKADVALSRAQVPVWTPDGAWLLISELGMDRLISADGKETREAGPSNAWAFAISADGRSLYGIAQRPGGVALFTRPLTGGPERIIGTIDQQLRPNLGLNPARRFSLAPDGKSFVYSTQGGTQDLWLLDGLDPDTNPL